MRNIPMELLRTFDKAKDTGSFTLAAAIVGRTQSAVSLQIKRLEEFLEVRLFERDTHRLRLTDEGRELAEYARRILAMNDEALGRMRRPQVAGSVKLGAPYEYTASLLPVFLGKFVHSHPAVRLEVVSDLSKNLLLRQDRGELDIVVALHEDPDEPRGTLVFIEPLVWISCADYQPHQQRPVSLVVAPPPCIYRSRVLQTLNRLGRASRIAYVSSCYVGISTAVRAGLGVTAMIGSATPAGVQRLVERDGFPPLGELEVRLHTLDEKQPNDTVRRLKDHIASSFAMDALPELAPQPFSNALRVEADCALSERGSNAPF